MPDLFLSALFHSHPLSEILLHSSLRWYWLPRVHCVGSGRQRPVHVLWQQHQDCRPQDWVDEERRSRLLGQGDSDCYWWTSNLQKQHSSGKGSLQPVQVHRYMCTQTVRQTVNALSHTMISCDVHTVLIANRFKRTLVDKMFCSIVIKLNQNEHIP